MSILSTSLTVRCATWLRAASSAETLKRELDRSKWERLESGGCILKLEKMDKEKAGCREGEQGKESIFRHRAGGEAKPWRQEPNPPIVGPVERNAASGAGIEQQVGQVA